MSSLSLLSATLGWAYFTLWSLSFWPQTLLLLRRRNLAGLSPDFVLLNTLGFACYSAATLALWASSAVRQAYRERHGEWPGTHANDVSGRVEARGAGVEWRGRHASEVTMRE
jgi:cystinosin